MIWTNLDFEYELRHGAAWRPPRPVALVLERWRTLLRCMPGRAEDVPWDGVTRDAHMLCWGESRRALTAMGHPDIEARLAAVKAANDKRTPYLLCSSPTLPCAGIVDSLDALHARLSDCPHDWVLKHPLGVSGRERVMGRQGEIDPGHARWAARQFAAGDALIFEPKVDIDHEYSWHVNILPDGDIEVLGQCVLLTDTQGTHRGHIIEVGARAKKPGDALLDEVRALHAHTGYTGALSSDGYVGHLGGEAIRREVSEFNARLTFGRVALALTRGLQDRSVAWWHPAASAASKIAGLEVWDGRDPQGWYRLPEHVDARGQSQTALYVGGASVELDASEIARRWDAL